jgi:hypothetical protein
VRHPGQQSHRRPVQHSLAADLALNKFGRLRRLVTFLLGIAVIIDSLTRKQNAVAEIYAGLILLGLVPVDEWLARR